MFDRLRSLLVSRQGWSFSAAAPSCDRGAAAEGETVILSATITNTGFRLGTAYARLFVADSYDRARPVFDSHQHLEPNARQSLRLLDIAPGERRNVSCRWTVPPGHANHHLDLRLQVWNPHLLFSGPKAHKFFDTGWVTGFEVLTPGTTTRQPVFISYSHDSDDHLRWVGQLREELLRHGVPTILDQTDLRPGQDISHFIEMAVTRAGVRLLICSERYTQKANTRQPGGVGFETVVSSKEYYHTEPEERVRFVPVVRNNTLSSAQKLPTYLGNALYIDMEGSEWRAEPMQRLLASIIPLLDSPAARV